MTSVQIALAAEVDRLRHDIERHVEIACELATECESLRAELAECRAHREDELNLAFRLGQTYCQQADSESYAENKRSAATKAKFHALIARKGEGEV